MSIFYKKIKTSNIYEEETCLSSSSFKSLLEQTKVQVLNNQELKILVTQEAQKTYVVTDLKASKILNKKNIDLKKKDDTLFTFAGNTYTDVTKQTRHMSYNSNSVMS
ncbi:21347_t:CDS:1 [Cetraspora pellucida]|uniref:21347_t:CDS:1 n=1 Tax=Cetraspora pellucida TaxID=1433469 RepID=A0A9N9FHK1_9GLOM|nr:21347_t:CDS:1 [Cetraspora pellucida]